MWNKIRDPSTHFVRSGCQGWGCSLRIPICGAMIYEVCSTNFFVSSLHQDLACWAKCIDKYMESKHLGIFFVILTPKNLLLFNFWKEILRLTSFAQDARGGGGCSLRCWVVWDCSLSGAMACEVFVTIFLLVAYTKAWHVERNVSINTWSRSI